MEVKDFKKEKSEYDKKRYQDNRKIILEKRKIWYQQNKEKRKLYMKEYYEKNKPVLLDSHRQWYINNHDIKNKYKRNKIKTNLKFNLNEKISSGIRTSIKNNKNGRHWETLVEYTLKDLQKRLQKTMPEGYTWEDFMNGKLHIDHIIPKSVFNFTKPEHIDFKKCWALKNLRLLPAKENLSKHDNLTKPFQPALKIKYAEVVR